MRSSVQHGLRLAIHSASTTLRPLIARPASDLLPSFRCQARALSTKRRTTSASVARHAFAVNNIRHFQTSTVRRNDPLKRPDDEPVRDTATKDDAAPETPQIPLPAPNPPVESAHENLPSHREQQRWDTSKKVSDIMEGLQERIAVTTQKLNTYTGTDYSGIQALRKQITEQEEVVKGCRTAIVDAKHALDAAFAQKSASQKEVVGLLERKHSWSDADLERYMSLVRSEHLNDQAVQNAKDRVKDAEQALEEARSQLEKVERKQYHEEQVWSDTIRRNSTWVTFGLMGFNVLVLLASIALIDPWRRRRLVREIKSTLEEHKPILTTEPLPAVAAPGPAQAAIDAVVEPIGVKLETLTSRAGIPEIPQQLSSSIPEEVLQMESVAVETHGASPASLDDPLVHPSPEQPTPVPSKSASHMQEVRAAFKNLFSEKAVTLRQIDITTYVIQGFSAGVIMAGLLVSLVLIQPQ